MPAKEDKKMISLIRLAATTRSAVLCSFVAASLLLVGSGCKSPVGVGQVSSTGAYGQINANALTTGTPSDATVIVLHRFGLEHEFKWHPRQALARLHEAACHDKRRDILFALSELNYLMGDSLGADWLAIQSPKQRAEQRTPENPQPFYLASSLYAYLYLLGSAEAWTTDPFDRKFRVACDLYNRALAKALFVGRGPDVSLAGGSHPLPQGALEIHFDSSHFRWPVEWIERALAADSFTVRGVSSRHRTPGLGAPLILVPKKSAMEANVPKYMMAAAGRMKGAATVFLRVQGDLRDLGTAKFHASLELYSPSDDPQVEVNGRKVPLETDETVALASSLQEAPVWKIDFKQLLSGEQSIPSGTYLLRSYQPGKIPVVFVHGTASNPARWTEMFNTLMTDPAIRQRYQFWFFVYNTGNPILYSESLLRDSLDNLVRQLDPGQKDPSLRQMVVIGHSQGGLLTRMLASPSGDRFWRNVSDKPFDQFKLSEPQRGLVRRALFFEPSPYVRRVVFVSTPHRGSYQIKGWLVSLTTRLIKLPGNLTTMGRDLLKTSGDSLPPQMRKGIPNSITNMRPGSPFAKALSDLKLAPNVKSHSIISVKGDGPAERGNDGVVAYTSAHLEGVESELVVRSAHSCQSKPATIEEVRRILYVHLDEMGPLK